MSNKQKLEGLIKNNQLDAESKLHEAYSLGFKAGLRLAQVTRANVEYIDEKLDKLPALKMKHKQKFIDIVCEEFIHCLVRDIEKSDLWSSYKIDFNDHNWRICSRSLACLSNFQKSYNRYGRETICTVYFDGCINDIKAALEEMLPDGIFCSITRGGGITSGLKIEG